MNPKPITEADYFVAWILFFLCALVAGALAGAVAGGVVGVVLAARGTTNETSLRVGGAVAGFIVSLPISYGFFRLFVGTFIVKKLLQRFPVAQSERPVQQNWPTDTSGPQQGL